MTYVDVLICGVIIHAIICVVILVLITKTRMHMHPDDVQDEDSFAPVTFNPNDPRYVIRPRFGNKVFIVKEYGTYVLAYYTANTGCMQTVVIELQPGDAVEAFDLQEKGSL